MLREIARIVVTDLSQRGTFYHDGQRGYVFLEADRRLVAVDGPSLELEALIGLYGIAPSERLFVGVVDALRLHAFRSGQRTDVHIFAHWDRDAATLYLHNSASQVYRITGDRIDCVDNGTDGVLFLNDTAHTPFSLQDRPSDGRSLLEAEIINPMPLCPDSLKVDERRWLFRVWLFSLFFPEQFPTRPILALVGEKGSTKTSSLRRIGQLLFGPAFNVTPLSNDPKDFDAAVSNTHFVAIDNADSKVPWLDDSLAVAATGGSFKRRALYTTNDFVEYRVRAFLGVTSRTPNFRRDDVADRLLVFKLARIKTFKSEARLAAELEESRDRIMTEIVYELQRIVQALASQADRTYATTFRMADFADFALKIASASRKDVEMRSILDRLSREQAAFAIEGEPLAEILDLWLCESGNPGRELTTAKLHRELIRVSHQHGMPFAWSTPASLGQHISNIESTLQQCLDLHVRDGRSRQRLFRFWPKQGGGDAPLAEAS